MPERADVVVLGAGAAGLAAAGALRAKDIDVLVLEARERIGGRVFTVHDPRLPVPIELGAEFVHGSAEEIRKLAGEAKLATVDISGRRWDSRRGTLRPMDDFWERLDRVMRRLDGVRGPDRSFQSFLDARPGGRPLARDRTLAKQYVEGFHAADAARISIRALAEGGSPRGDEQEERIGRIYGGYDGVIGHLAGEIGDIVRLGAVVTAVRWDRGEVEVSTRAPDGSSQTAVTARAAILTVPLGVLHAPAGEPGAIAFDPPLERDRGKREALGTLAMGAVMRVTLRTRDTFWADERFRKRIVGVTGEALDTLSFLHSDDPCFPVWWTAYPVRAPLLVAWSGGPTAQAMVGRPEEEIIGLAVRALGDQFRIGAREARRQVEGAWLHDWESDPYARGAYSYAMVGGSESAAALARPLRRTLFLAGEASDPEGRTGTLDGAIGSGRRAAKAVIRALLSS